MTEINKCYPADSSYFSLVGPSQALSVSDLAFPDVLPFLPFEISFKVDGR